MIGSITPNLPSNLLGYLRPGAPGLLLTTGTDGYASSAYTWVVATDDKHLRFGVDEGGSAMNNATRTGQVSLQIVGPDDISFLIKGTARQVKARIDAAAPNVIMLWEMEVMGARDQTWRGVKTTALRYEWPAEQREAMLRMEQAVYAEMRGLAA